jgi:hypothetical protein
MRALDVAQIAATLMSAGQLGINDISQAVDKAIALVENAESKIKNKVVAVPPQP